jgi:hypothetical protein
MVRLISFQIDLTHARRLGIVAGEGFHTTAWLLFIPGDFLFPETASDLAAIMHAGQGVRSRPDAQNSPAEIDRGVPLIRTRPPLIVFHHPQPV